MVAHMRVIVTWNNFELVFTGRVECKFSWRDMPVQTRLLLKDIAESVINDSDPDEVAAFIEEVNTHHKIKITRSGNLIKINSPNADNLAVTMTHDELEILANEIAKSMDVMKNIPLIIGQCSSRFAKYPANEYRYCTLSGEMDCETLSLSNTDLYECHIKAKIIEYNFLNTLTPCAGSKSSITCHAFHTDTPLITRGDVFSVAVNAGIIILSQQATEGSLSMKYSMLLTSSHVVVMEHSRTTSKGIGREHLRNFTTIGKNLGDKMKTWQLVFTFGPDEDHYHWNGDRFTHVTDDTLLQDREYCYPGTKKYHRYYQKRFYQHLVLKSQAYLNLWPGYQLLESKQCCLIHRPIAPKSARAAI